MKTLTAITLAILLAMPAMAQQSIINHNGSNGSNGDRDYGLLTKATAGQATLGAMGVGDVFANLNLGSTINGVRRFWHLSKRTSAIGHSLQHWYFNGSAFELKQTMLPNGNLGLGTATPRAKLDVNGTVRAKEVRVEASPWPDYVFADDHSLMPLEQTAQYIKDHRRLPGMPAAEEVAKEGASLGEINRLLVEKIEEMTLYQIELLERVKKLEEKINKP